MKNKRKLEKAVSDFCYMAIGSRVKCSLDTDFYYYPNRKVIGFGVVCPVDADALFLEAINEFNPTVSADIFLWSLLHEIGHYMTWDSLTDDEIDDCLICKDGISEGVFEKAEYYQCIDEYLANEWAVKFANSHAEMLAKAWTDLQSAIMDFYKINNIEIP